jgi:predicted ribosomally synthesized peptide with SipW-like signal peptide
MRRPVLLSMVALGVVVTAVAGAGTFAPFTDRATSGTNSVASAERPRAADLKLAFNVTGVSSCSTATYADNGTSPGMTANDAQPGSKYTAFFCLKNVGASAVTASGTSIDLVDIDTGCTGDEAVVDTTCGDGQAGELGSILSTYIATLACDGSTGQSTFGGTLASPTPVSLGTIQPGAMLCGQVEVSYGLNRTADEVQRAQSDTATWKWAFTGTTS